MDSFDVVIVGGGPAGSSCAWALRESGLNVAILDKQTFPRNKVCGGWITPQVLEELEIDPAEYGRGRILQPITGFRTGPIRGDAVETSYGRPVSYGIRRCEFDGYLLERCGARVFQGEPVQRLERSGGAWIINGHVRACMLVGAGGTFCPVARFLGAKVNGEALVRAQEAEFVMDRRQSSECSVREEIPELYFCSDMKGYAWCFRKQNVLNVGLGRLDRHSLTTHVTDFLRFLKQAGRLSFDLPATLLGHAYLLFGTAGRDVAGEGVLLAGDAAGVAYAQSGEGIRPAVESGLLAANVILTAQGTYTLERLERYRQLLAARLGAADRNPWSSLGRHLPAQLIPWLAKPLLRSGWFTREIVLNRWFLRQNDPVLKLT